MNKIEKIEVRIDFLIVVFGFMIFSFELLTTNLWAL